FLLQLGGADKARNQWYQAHLEEEKRAGEQAKAQAQGSQFVRNDPGTLAARRCIELGGNELECVGKGFWTGLMDMAGVDGDSISAVGGSEVAGVIMNGRYQSGTLGLGFGTKSFSLTGCGQLVPNGHGYSISKKPNQLLINVNSEPNSFVLSMGADGSLAG